MQRTLCSSALSAISVASAIVICRGQGPCCRSVCLFSGLEVPPFALAPAPHTQPKCNTAAYLGIAKGLHQHILLRDSHHVGCLLQGFNQLAGLHEQTSKCLLALSGRTRMSDSYPNGQRH